MEQKHDISQSLAGNLNAIQDFTVHVDRKFNIGMKGYKNRLTWTIEKMS